MNKNAVVNTVARFLVHHRVLYNSLVKENNRSAVDTVLSKEHAPPWTSVYHGSVTKLRAAIEDDLFYEL
jgi:hypothetical protein